MTLTFTGAAVSRGFTNLLQQSNPLYVPELQSCLGMARPVLQQYPETAGHLRALELRRGNLLANWTALKRKAPQVQERFHDVFAPNAEHSYRDLMTHRF
ncbi:MAG: hypothetical protein R3245_06935, partial [Kiloniellales bacterium]|nr:hypothetical protein [Kiloniellales bacterium]